MIFIVTKLGIFKSPSLLVSLFSMYRASEPQQTVTFRYLYNKIHGVYVQAHHATGYEPWRGQNGVFAVISSRKTYSDIKERQSPQFIKGI
jgi:hypothetical protein